MASFLSKLGGWLDLGTQIYGIYEDHQAKKEAQRTGQAASQIPGQAPGFGINATQQLFDTFGQPITPGMQFQGFSGNDIESLRNELYSTGMAQVQRDVQDQIAKVYQDAEARGMPSGIISQATAQIIKNAELNAQTMRTNIDTKVAGLLQTQNQQKNLFGLQKYDRQAAANLLPYNLSQGYSNMFGNQAFNAGQLNLGGQTLGGQFQSSVGQGAAGLIDSLLGQGGEQEGSQQQSNVYGGVNLDNPMGMPGAGLGNFAKGALNVVGGAFGVPGVGNMAQGVLGSPETQRNATYNVLDQLDPAQNVYGDQSNQGANDTGSFDSVEPGDYGPGYF